VEKGVENWWSEVFSTLAHKKNFSLNRGEKWEKNVHQAKVIFTLATATCSPFFCLIQTLILVFFFPCISY